MVNVSDLTSYLVCPRLCYFRMRFGGKTTEMNALKEIYLSLRKGYDMEWAKERFLEYGGDIETFESAKKTFKLSSELEKLKPLDWEVKLISERYGLKGILDEVVDFNSKPYPLVLSKRYSGVRFRDKIKVTAFCMLLSERDLRCESGFVYYCGDGVLKRVNVGRKERYYTLKLIEKVRRVEKGYLPEKGRANCDLCEFKEVCNSQPVSLWDKLRGV